MQIVPNIVTGTHDTDIVACDKWFIFRYKVLNKRIKEYFQNNDKVFFPYRKVRKIQETAKVEYVEQPMVPGYIFVNAELDDAIALGKEVDMNPWRKRLDEIDTTVAPITPSERKVWEEKHYYSIKDGVMRQFIRAVDGSSKDVKILDASYIDLAKDDFVEIIAGPYAGYKGYLKSVNGSNGGLVVVPLETEGDNEIPANSLFHYGIPAKSCEVSILSFAEGSHRASDQLNHASKVVDKVMEAYTNGEKITVQQTTRLQGYIDRFSKVQLKRPIQRIRLALMLYRIFTIFENKERESVRKQLDELLNECEQRKDNTRKRDKASAETTYQEYQDIKRKTEKAFEERDEALSKKRKLQR